MGEPHLKNVVDMLDKYSRQSLHEKKYFALKRKCQQLEEQNVKLLYRLQYVKGIVRQYAQERQNIMSKLDEHLDDYREAARTALLNEGNEDQSTMNPVFVDDLATTLFTDVDSIARPRAKKVKQESHETDKSSSIHSYASFLQGAGSGI